MTSMVDAAVPVYGNPTTASVRGNFQIIHDEITALQALMAPGPFLPIAGGEITGNLAVDGNTHLLGTLITEGRLTVDGSVIDVVAPAGEWGWLSVSREPGQKAVLQGATHELTRWQIDLADDTPETGGNAGSNFQIRRHGDAGFSADLGAALAINRATGDVMINTTTDAGYRLDVNAPNGVRLAITPQTAPVIVHGVGATLPAAFPTSTLLQLVGVLNGNPGITIDALGTTGTGGIPQITGRAVNQAGGTFTGTPLLNIRGFGHDGTNFSSGARAVVALGAAETFTTTAQGTVIAFSTTAIGTTTLAEVMRVSPSGNLLIGTTTDSVYRLDAVGVSRISIAAANTLGLVIANNPVYASASATPGTLLHMQGPDNGGTTRALIDVFGTATTASYTTRKAGGTSAAPTAVGLSLGIGSFGSWSYDGATYANRAQMTFVTSQAHSVGANGTLIRFQMTKDNTAALFTAMEVRGDGNLYALADVAVTGRAGFNGATPLAKPAITGSRAGNAALAALLTSLATYGLITDSTTA
jgi:hypothetical protein